MEVYVLFDNTWYDNSIIGIYSLDGYKTYRENLFAKAVEKLNFIINDILNRKNAQEILAKEKIHEAEKLLPLEKEAKFNKDTEKFKQLNKKRKTLLKEANKIKYNYPSTILHKHQSILEAGKDAIIDWYMDYNNIFADIQTIIE